jgi:hypothetical protein
MRRIDTCRGLLDRKMNIRDRRIRGRFSNSGILGTHGLVS